MPEKLLIVEEALRDLKAHWFEYIKTIEKAVRQEGWQVEVASHKNAAPEITQSLNCHPLFNHARYLHQEKDRLPGERYYGFILHSYRSLQALWPFLKKHRYNAVFVPTVLVHHLLAWYMIMRMHPNKPGQVTLFFVTPPGVWDAAQGKTVFPGSTVIMKKMLRLFKNMIGNGKVILAVETKAAQHQFSTLTGLPFTLMPHPVPFDGSLPEPAAAGSSVSVNGSGKQLVTFGCFGFARHEKGSDLLKAAIESILQDGAAFNGRFLFQWTDPFQMPDNTMCTPGEFLESHPQVTIIDKPLSGSDYQSLLLQTDCMILPYRNASYHARVSRIAIEAVCNGIPVVYTNSGWLEENIENFGAGIGIKDESVEDLIGAITAISNDFSRYADLAKEKVQKARTYYSPAHFSKMLLNAEGKNLEQAVVTSHQAL